VDARIGSTVGSLGQLVGAFAIGGALHQSLVQGTVPITAPVPVLSIALGTVLIAVGHRIEQRYGGGRRPAVANETDGPDKSDRTDEGENGAWSRGEGGSVSTENSNGEHERNRDDEGEGEFDERWAPFDAADLDKYERDDDYDATRSNRR
jgi:hypothetical protein